MIGSLIAGIAVLLIALHALCYMFGYKNVVPNLIEKAIKKGLLFIFKAIWMLMRAIVRGIIEAFRHLKRER